MKQVKKPVFFIVAIVILTFSYLAIFGVHGQKGDLKTVQIKGVEDIRWGIDISGGVEATFQPAGGDIATSDQLNAAKSIIELRLVKDNVTDYEIYSDSEHSRVIVRFPWNTGETEFDPESAIKKLAATAVLTFREGNEYETTSQDEDGVQVGKTPKGVTAEKILVEGKDIKSAKASTKPKTQGSAQTEDIVSLEFNEEGTRKFAEATKNLKGKTMSIWMDDTMISSPSINEEITTGEAMISGSFTAKSANALADKINAGALPFKLEVANFSTISPTLGRTSLDAMLIAGIIAFSLICFMMLGLFRLPGFIACIGLTGHVALSFAAVSGFFNFVPSFTLTLPGIAGLILSIGIGVDTNIISASRIKEELWGGKTLSNSIQIGNKNSFRAIFDGNITVLIVALILMGIFGPVNILSGLFGAATTGSIYSFGYMLLVGVISNFLMGVMSTHLMIKSISRYKCASNKWLYGGKRNESI